MPPHQNKLHASTISWAYMLNANMSFLFNRNIKEQIFTVQNRYTQKSHMLLDSTAIQISKVLIPLLLSLLG